MGAEKSKIKPATYSVSSEASLSDSKMASSYCFLEWWKGQTSFLCVPFIRTLFLFMRFFPHDLITSPKPHPNPSSWD
jgi:hypothetical protein